MKYEQQVRGRFSRQKTQSLLISSQSLVNKSIPSNLSISIINNFTPIFVFHFISQFYCSKSDIHYFQIVKDSILIVKDRDAIDEDWSKLSKIGLSWSCHFEAATPQVFLTFTTFPFIFSTIMDKKQDINPSSIYISAFEAFWLSNLHKTTSKKKQLHHHMVSNCPVVTLLNQNNLQVGVKSYYVIKYHLL